MENVKMPKVIFERVHNGQTVLVNATTPAGNQGQFILTMVKPGNPFWYWESIPGGRVIAADFTNAPICGTTAAENNAILPTITTAPEDVLTWQ